ncbi:hypothetical protein ACFWA9_32965 [Kitasatospora sp. NPDC059973]|uniref:hypothetical protein n=1 Tax=Kitasatospora sp. NPDC059973 TaxID=3347020 RepID=UPI0036AD5EC3
MTAGERRRRGRGRAAARPLLLCALLAGLFLMHGSPTAPGGCHRPAAVAVAGSAGHRAAVAHHAAPADAPRLDGRRAPDAAPQAVPCVSARDREGAGLPAAAPLAAGAAAVLPAVRMPSAPRERRTTGPRAPPDAGRRLLLRVCVART